MTSFSGTTLKGYDLQERIGAGGFGVVYRAFQSTVGREVAIKIILPALANKPEFIRRFETEAQLVAKIEHLHIVPLYDYWRDPDGAYLVMRYLRKGSLKDLLAQNALDLETIALLLDQIASALSTAHRSQVIHRDIKPANILLDEDGNAYLADFGIAKDVAAENGTVTEAEAVVGSPDYLSPEQARNESVTPQTDIYSLGVVLYEMLKGEHPFPGKAPIERLFSHLNEPIPEIDTLDDDIRDAVNKVIQKATSKDPAKRYEDVLELAAAFRDAASLRVSQLETRLVELLTPREQEVLKLIVKGNSNREIADKMVVEITTVKSYIKSIYRKLNVRSRVQAIVKARELNLIVDGFEGGAAATTTYSHLPPPVNPYKGLRAFTIADEKDFFGRERSIDKLLRKLGQAEDYSRFLAVVGPSGSGKSSLVKAGLIPALWRGKLKGSENWYVVEMVPGTHPLEELEVALMRIASDQGLNLGEQLTRDERGLIRSARMLLPDDGSELLIVIDQFEEVFTLVEDEEKRAHFLALLYNAVTDMRSQVRVLVTMRADFYDRPLRYPDFGKMIHERMETVLPLGAEELERAIVEPAQQMGVTFEDGVVATIISEINYQPGALPLLQYALTELFEHHENRKLTHDAYQNIGRAVGALATRAEETYKEFDEAGQEVIHQIFLRLVTLGEGVEDTRRRVDRHELIAITDDAELVDEVIDTFAAYRLLSLDRDPATRQPMVEVAHEALLREWERLREWLNESRSDIRLQRQLARLADEWQHAERDPGFLIPGGKRLEQFGTWRQTTELALTQLEVDYLQASLEAEDQRATREAQEKRTRQTLQRGLFITMAVGLVVAIGLSIFAFQERSKALQQASVGLAAQAVAALDSNSPERGVLLALTALEEYPYTAQAESALAQAVYGTHPYMTLSTIRNRTTSMAFSPDGTLIAGSEWSLLVWDAATGEVISEFDKENEDYDIYNLDWLSDSRTLLTASRRVEVARVWDAIAGEELVRYAAHEGAVYSVHASPDDILAVSSSADGTAHIWRIETGETVLILEGHDAEVQDAKWSPDGSQIATASLDGSLRFWDGETGAELRRIDAHLGGVASVSWSSDGSRIASAGNDGLGRIWNAETGDLLVTLIGHNGVVTDIEWSPDDNLLASGGRDGLVRVWEAQSGIEQFSLAGADTETGTVSWSPDGEQLSAGGGLSPRVWDVTSPVVRLIGYSPGENAYIQTNLPYWSPDSSWVGAGGNYENTYRFWDPLTGENSRTFDRVPGGEAIVNPAGTEIILARPPHTRIVNLETGVERSISLPEAYDESVLLLGGWSADGSLFSLRPQSPEYYIYDAETLELLFTGKGRECAGYYDPAFSPDSKYLALRCWGGESNMLITETLTGEVVMELEDTSASAYASWSPDGKRLAITSFMDFTIQVWDMETGEAVTVFTGHTSSIPFVDWSPNGERLVSGDFAGNILIWDADTGGEVNRYNVGGGAFGNLWSPDGTRMLTTGFFDAPDIRPVWQSTEDLIEYAYGCCVTRELTPEEHDQFGLPPLEE